jgi:uncharacterized secreted protein with C-terminal beta-propeller domain
MKRLIYVLVAVALSASVAIVVAGGGGSAGGIAKAAPKPVRAALKPFDSCDRLRGYLVRHLSSMRATAYPEVVEDGVAAEAAGGSAPAPSDGQTNVQEAGVDEPDLVKARGSTLFVLAGDRLRAVDVSGAEPAVLGSIELPHGQGESTYVEEERELLVAGARALVISRSYGLHGTRTLLTDLDVANPAAMRVLATETVEGNYVSARLTGDTARVVIAAYPEMPVAERGHGRAWMPRTVVRDRVTHRRTRRSLMRCEDVRRPTRFSGTGMLSVLTIDMVRGLPAVDTDAVMAGGEIVYGSPTSLYVATQRWFEPQPLIERGVTAPESSEVTTEIHRFDVADPGTTRYVASGEVEGYMLDQWSMSEHDGLLRVASTSAPPWDASGGVESESFVTALRLEGDRLVKVGRVGGLGRGEQIYAVRFMGNLGYVVTFRQVDPLYVLDLSDPRDPRKLGELKIPGYSAYLHPVGEGLLLGIGQDATQDGQTTGVQVSLFDVSDPAAPVRVDREALGRGTYTEVEHDHHAFTYSPDHGLAVLPLSAWIPPAEEFYGAVGVRVDPVTGLERTARTSHGPGYEAEIRRSVIVDGRVFTISARGVAEHHRATMARLAFTPYAAD